MKYRSALVTEASGSLGGFTASRNKGGLYFRARAIPTNPNSTYQQTVRSALAQLVTTWGSTLSAAQRAAWSTYAANTTVIGPLGTPIHNSGLNMYLRGNVSRLQTTLPRVDDGPTVYDLGGYTEPSIGFDATAGEIDVTFDNTDAWANEDDAAMLVYVSRPQGPGVEFFKGPYRLAGLIAGDSTTPPTSPAAITLPFAVTAGQRMFARIVVSRADGRLSASFRDGAIAA